MFAFRAAPSLQPSSLNPTQQTHLHYFPKSPHLHSLLFSPNPCLRSAQTPLSSPNNNLNSPTTTPINNNPSIQSLSKQGKLKEALKLLSNEPNPNQQTFEFLILACSKANDLDNGRFVHRRLVRDGFEQDPFLATKLINFYSDCKSLDEARTVFNGIENKTLFVYNALIRGLTLLGNSEEALSLYQKMYLDGVEFDQFTFPYILKACVVASASSLQGKEIHGHVLRRGFESDVYITTTLIDVYGKFGCLGYARHVFDKMPMRNVVSWSAMIASYARNNRNFEALDLFGKMMVEEKTDFVPNSVTMVSVLQACGSLVALQQGKLIHGYILRRELDSIVSVVNSLVTMYAKCGSVGTARWVFDRMERRDVVSWNSMISGYGIHGFGREAIWVFEEMIKQGVSPTPVTFVSVLGACSHVGLVREGQRLFDSMVNDYGIVPSTEHYASMIDLLGRAGQLSKAAEIIETMPIDPCPAVWGALLGSCRIHGSVELAERASHCLFELEPLNAGNYVLLADIYATYEMWEDVDRVKKTLEARGLQKVAGCSWIEVKKKIYSFVSVDEINPHIEQLHAFLVQLLTEMKERGYIPNTRVVLYDLDQEEKERIVLGHSEKLALAFGLINSSNGETIRITKNLRLCEDCHSVTKFISKFADREILVRDVNRFHHFRDGVCSCADYW